MTKSEIRKLYKEKRSALTLSQVEEMSAEIQYNIFSLPQYNDCKTLFTFINYGKEVVTKNIIKDALKKGKEVAVPYMTGKPHEMVFLKIEGLDNLVENKYGILEPVFNEEDILNSDESTFIIVPALVLGNNKNRMGYGGGFYDKYLEKHPNLHAVAIAFELQMYRELPFEEHDIKPEKVITEKHIYPLESGECFL